MSSNSVIIANIHSDLCWGARKVLCFLMATAGLGGTPESVCNHYEVLESLNTVPATNSPKSRLFQFNWAVPSRIEIVTEHEYSFGWLPPEDQTG